MTRRARTIAALALLAAIAIPAVAWARPGGGNSYSGGGGHGGGGGGGGGDGGAIFELIFQLIRLCVYYPQVGVPLLVIVIGFIAYGSWVKHKNKDWDSGPPVALEDSVTSIDAITRVDPDFSLVLFEDFVFRLYATAHGLRGQPARLDELAPYMSVGARAALASRPPTGQPVTGVVIGAMRTVRVSVPSADEIEEHEGDDGGGAAVTVGLEFEANYSVGTGKGSKRFAVERWVLRRAVTAHTRPPSAVRSFPCPNCGAPWQTADAAGTQRCPSCSEVVDNGRFDWQVVDIGLRHERNNLPSLAENVEERGTSLPTYRDDHLDQRWLALTADDPQIAEASLIARLHYVYQVVNAAWTANDLGPARAVVSDGLADYLQYWLDAYKAQGLRNVLEGMRITHQVPAKLIRDKYYDAITIRIWGTGKDYVIRTADGSHVSGNRSRERKYSEYWTLIRSANRHGPTRADGACSNCGAPLTVTQTGACAHCGTHVTAGEFDWVLSKIEQDDSYRG
ncbi:MAG: TIM44-like domain-containing protein [Myxococcales bacterium]|nr:TIM44-like domain-containing protein [Myxococcales bacterium]